MIEIINYQPDFKNRRLLEQISEFAGKMLSDFKKSRLDVNIVLCDDKFIRALNRKYRGKDSPTDVLSFSQAEEGEEDLFDNLEDLERTETEGSPLGDVIISLDTAVRQAKEFKVTEEEEMGRLVIHGMLHLLGFDHETSKEDEKIMMKKQDAYLERFLKNYSH